MMSCFWALLSLERDRLWKNPDITYHSPRPSRRPQCFTLRDNPTFDLSYKLSEIKITLPLAAHWVHAATRGQPRPEQASCTLGLGHPSACGVEDESLLHGDHTPRMAGVLLPQAPAHSEPHLHRGHFNMTWKDLMPLARKARSGRQ